MSNFIEQPRFGCTIGAQQSVIAIERAIPILHSGPGCAAKQSNLLGFSSGYQGSGYAGGNAIPCTNSGEREVVFGGIEKLKDVIDGALKVMDGDLFIVLTGCTADIVGDDVENLVRDYQEEGIKIVHAETAGFKGNSYQGHELVTEAIINQLLKPAEIENNLVNVWSSVPYQDPFWRGNLDGIRELLEGIGLKVNILFGHASGGVAAWEKIPSAQFNLVISPWVGVKTAKLLEEKFGTPYLHYPTFPIGAIETGEFLRKTAEFAGVDIQKAEEFIKKEEDKFYSYTESAADFLLEARYDLPERFYNLLDAHYSLGISKFLVNELGLLPGHQYITDNTPEEFREDITKQFEKLNETISSKLSFISDGKEIEDELAAYKHKFKPLILGTSWDEDVAKKIDGFRLSIGIPVTDRIILDRSYVGYKGGLRLIEDIYSTVLQNNEGHKVKEK